MRPTCRIALNLLFLPHSNDNKTELPHSTHVADWTNSREWIKMHRQDTKALPSLGELQANREKNGELYDDAEHENDNNSSASALCKHYYAPAKWKFLTEALVLSRFSFFACLVLTRRGWHSHYFILNTRLLFILNLSWWRISSTLAGVEGGGSIFLDHWGGSEWLWRGLVSC